MPISSSPAKIERRRSQLRSSKSIDQNSNEKSDFLKIESALPANERRKLYRRSHSTLNNVQKSVAVQNNNGSVHVLRSQCEKETNPDRISLDRKGLTTVPVIDGEIKLRLLSLQHNLISNLEGLKPQKFPYLVFLDIYDNQLDRISALDNLDNLRVLLMGKNRIKKIEGLTKVRKIEVLDLHGNQISHVNGLDSLNELKVLNLAGNQIKFIGISDLHGLVGLQELNLRRNRLRRLLGFGETPNLSKLFLSNNDLQNVEDIGSLVKSTNLKEVSIDNNPIFLNGDCVSFLVSYLPNLSKLNTIQISEQVRKAALAWKRNKETTNAAFMDLSTDVCLNVHREEVISNARTNWELLRAQTKCLKTATTKNVKPVKDFQADLILTSFNKKTVKLPNYIDKKLIRTSSQDTTETSSSNTTSSTEFFRLPPILVPIISKMGQKENLKRTESLSSLGANVDSSSTISSESVDSSDEDEVKEEVKVAEEDIRIPEIVEVKTITETSSQLSTNSSSLLQSNSSNDGESKGRKRAIKSAALQSHLPTKTHLRAATAKLKKSQSPKAIVAKDCEQGGDYLIEICGRYLNIYGQCALRYIDKNWNQSKANDVNTVHFSYVNFNSIANYLNKLKQKFPNIEHFHFKETNIYCLGQLNALAEVQGLSSLTIESEGNPLTEKCWQNYAIYRLSHWGLKNVNNQQITDTDTEMANKEYESLSDLVLWSLPDLLLQPLLVRLRLEINEENAKKWLLTADPALKSVVCKEALQWKKEDGALRQRAKLYISGILDEMCSAVGKLKRLDDEWSEILLEFVTDTLVDYSQLDVYMKQKMYEVINNK